MTIYEIYDSRLKDEGEEKRKKGVNKKPDRRRAKTKETVVI